MLCHQLIASHIISTSLTSYINVIYIGIKFARNTLGTCKNGGVVMQEVKPQMYVVPHWHLVSNEAHNPQFAFPTIFHHLAQCLCHGDRLCPHTSAELQEHLVHRLVLKFVVYLSECHFIVIFSEMNRYRRH